jgi:hypothetical protein
LSAFCSIDSIDIKRKLKTNFSAGIQGSPGLGKAVGLFVIPVKQVVGADINMQPLFQKRLVQFEVNQGIVVQFSLLKRRILGIKVLVGHVHDTGINRKPETENILGLKCQLVFRIVLQLIFFSIGGLVLGIQKRVTGPQ